MKGLARLLQLLAAVGLMVSPFLSWAQFEFLGSEVGFPGILLHGSVLLAAGVMAGIMVLVGSRRFGFRLVLALLSGVALAYDVTQITGRTEYWMGKAQLWLVQINGLVTKLGMSRIELFQKRTSGWDYLASGVGLGACAIAVLALGVILEVWAESREGRRFFSLVWGRPRCRCGSGFDYKMRFCPGCGRCGEAVACGSCGGVVQPQHRFCSQCGARQGAAKEGGED